jgi:hypothetical protein
MCEFFEDEIISIELVPEEMETVDISVSDDNLFIVNGVLTHNCAFGGSAPGMEHIAESIGVASTSDVILSIFQTDEDMEMGLIRLGMIKNRFGPRGMVQPMRIDYNTLTITQSEEEEEIMNDDDLSVLERLAKS